MAQRMEPGDTALGEVMREIRERRNFSQEFVAGKLGIKSDKLRHFEQGIQMPTIPELKRFRDELRLNEVELQSIDRIINITRSPSPLLLFPTPKK